MAALRRPGDLDMVDRLGVGMVGDYRHSTSIYDAT